MKPKCLLLGTLLATLLTILTLYKHTAPQGITWENAELYEATLVKIIRSDSPATVSGQHPLPTSPLYKIVAPVFLTIDVSPAKALGAMSIICSVITLSLLVAAVYRLTRSGMAALIAVSFLSTNPTFWRYSTNANTSILALVLLSVSFFLINEVVERKRTLAVVFLLGIANGLAISTFPQATVAVVALWIFLAITKTKPDVWLRYCLGLILGVMPILLLAATSPSSLFQGWLGWILPIELGPSDIWMRLADQGALLFQTPTWPLFLLAILGWLWEKKDGRKPNPANYFCLALVADLIFNALHVTPNRELYLLPELLLAAILAGLGFDLVASLLIRIIKTKLAVAYESRFLLVIVRVKEANLGSRVIIYGTLLGLSLLPALAGIYEIRKISASGERNLAANYLTQVDKITSPNSLIITDDPKIAAALGYLELVRPEKAIITTATDFPFNQEALEKIRPLSPTLPQKTLPPTEQNEGGHWVKKVIEEALANRDVYFAPAQPPISGAEASWESFRLTPMGALFKLSRT